MTLSPQPQPSSRPILTAVRAIFAIAVVHIGWSLFHGSQYIYSITSIHTNVTNNNYYYFLHLPPAIQSAPSLEDIASLPSKWFVTAESQRQNAKHKLANQLMEEDPRPFVAVVMCARSKPEWQNISDTTLHTLLIPSIVNTITADEWKTFRIELFVGFDTGDAFWEDRRNRNLLQTTTTQSQPNLGINFMALNKKRPSQIPFNAACRAAYELGSDYIVRINDDTEFLTEQWITQGIQQLSKFKPKNLGVVGPKCDQGNTDILTHDMVHRLHLDIFGMEYYPDEFDNWWIDDWITAVYGGNNTQRIDTWEVHHHIHQHGTRYRVDEALQRHLATTVKRGRDTIRKYLNQRKFENGGGGGASGGQVSLPKSKMEFQVLGSNQIPAAWGPSLDRFYNH